MSRVRFPAVVPTLVGESFSLRELAEEDIPPWFERATDTESADLAGDPVPASMDVGSTWLDKHREAFRKKTGLRWAIVPVGSSLSVGTIGLTVQSGDERLAELGIVVARSWWGKGLGSAAARVVAHYAFSEVGLSEIQAEVLQRNLSSIRLLEKTGFKLVRVLPPTAAEPEVMLQYSLFAGGRDVAHVP